MGKIANSSRFYVLWLQNHCWCWLQPWNLKTLAPWKKSYDKPRQCIKKQRHHFMNRCPYSQSYDFSAPAADKLLQLCPPLWDPRDSSPPGSPNLWDSQGKNTGVGCHFLLQCMKVKSESEVTQSCPTLSNSMDYSSPGSSIHGIFQARVLMIFLAVMNRCESWTIGRLSVEELMCSNCGGGEDSWASLGLQRDQTSQS